MQTIEPNHSQGRYVGKFPSPDREKVCKPLCPESLAAPGLKWHFAAERCSKLHNLQHVTPKTASKPCKADHWPCGSFGSLHYATSNSFVHSTQTAKFLLPPQPLSISHGYEPFPAGSHSFYHKNSTQAKLSAISLPAA